MLRFKKLFKPTAGTVSPESSSNSTSQEGDTGANLSTDSSINSHLSFNQEPVSGIPNELVPIVTLLNSHNSRIYFTGDVFFNDSLIHNELLSASVTIKGTKLTIFQRDNTLKPKLISLLDFNISIQSDSNALIFTQIQRNPTVYNIKFNSLHSLQECFSAIKLSVYEFNHLNESYTASLLSCRGVELSDLHVVLAEDRHVYQEHCSVKINGEWKSCLIVVNPFEKKNFSKSSRKTGSVSIYYGSKATKRNLICSIDSVDNCFAVFTHVDLIDESSIIKIDGDFSFYNNYLEEDQFVPRSRSSSIISNSHKRTSSITSNTAKRNSSNGNSHKRNISTSSINSTSNDASRISKATLYIMPKSHHSVQNFEILIRLLIPIYDAFQLYGRSDRLIADKRNPESLLFGLPSLPNSQILTDKHALTLVQDNWSFITDLEETTSSSNDSYRFDFNALFNSKVELLYQTPDYQGFGNYQNDLQQHSVYQDPVVTYKSPDQRRGVYGNSSKTHDTTLESIALNHKGLNILSEH